MSLPLALAAAAVVSLGSGADTTIAVSRGTSLQIANFAGQVSVRAWEKNAVRVTAEATQGNRIMIKLDGKILFVKGHGKMSGDPAIDLNIVAPSWMDLAVSGIHTDVMIDGTKGRVRVETVHGDIAVSGGRGEIQLNAVNQDIHLVDASGIVLSETVNGDMTFQRINSDSVDVSTVNGEIFYEGSINDKGVYKFTSHNGDIAVALPKTADAMVNVSTFSGDFASDFPVSLTETKKGRQFCFILGKGTAQVDLESFQGTIHIFRPGSRGPVAEMETPETRVYVKPKVVVVPPKPPKEEKAPKAPKGKREYGGEQDDDEDEDEIDAPEAPEPPDSDDQPDHGGHENGLDLDQYYHNVNRD
jgi:hypothetical protein